MSQLLPKTSPRTGGGGTINIARHIWEIQKLWKYLLACVRRFWGGLFGPTPSLHKLEQDGQMKTLFCFPGRINLAGHFKLFSLWIISEPRKIYSVTIFCLIYKLFSFEVDEVSKQPHTTVGALKQSIIQSRHGLGLFCIIGDNLAWSILNKLLLHIISKTLHCGDLESRYL